jgi:hypothetical protein
MTTDTTNPITDVLNTMTDDDRVFILPAVMVVVSEEQYAAMLAESQLIDPDEKEN